MSLARDKGLQKGQQSFQGLAGPDQDDVLDILPEGPGEASVCRHQQPCLYGVALAASAQADQQEDVWPLHAGQIVCKPIVPSVHHHLPAQSCPCKSCAAAYIDLRTCRSCLCENQSHKPARDMLMGQATGPGNQSRDAPQHQSSAQPCLACPRWGTVPGSQWAQGSARCAGRRFCALPCSLPLHLHSQSQQGGLGRPDHQKTAVPGSLAALCTPA